MSRFGFFLISILMLSQGGRTIVRTTLTKSPNSLTLIIPPLHSVS